MHTIKKKSSHHKISNCW